MINRFIKKRGYILLFFAFTVTSASSQDFLKNREVQLLTHWDFLLGNEIPPRVTKYATRNWTPVSVPHTWNAKDVLEKGFEMYKGQGWYKTNLKISPQKGKRYFLRFEGAAIVADVYVNNRLIGEHKGSYTAFIFELTDHLREGNNELKVGVSNAFRMDVAPNDSDLYPSFGGIYRPVTLFTTSNLCISPLDDASTGVYISTPNVGSASATVNIKTLVNYKADDGSEASANVETIIKNREGNIVASAKSMAQNLLSEKTKSVSVQLTVNNPIFWDAKRNPYLYRVIVLLKDEQGKTIDEIAQPLGIRSFFVDANKGFYLNEKKYDLYGTTRHQEWEGLGPALSDANHKTDMYLINELGANMLRLAHYPQAEMMYATGDTTGIVIWAEVPVTPPYRFNFQPYIENTHQQLREMVKQLYNHPSILFWGMQNESHIPANDLAELHKQAKLLDPYRLTTQGDHTSLQERHFITDLVAWNRYYGWYGGKFDDLTTWYNGIKSKFPSLKVGISEYGAGGSISQQEENPKVPDPTAGKFYPEQYQRLYHEETYRRLKKMNGLWCKIIWNTFDFSWENVDRGDRPFINHKGLITHDRKTKKDAFYFYKTQWTNEPVLYLLDRRLVKRSHANTVVAVYTNQPNPTLKVNNKVIKGREYDAELKKYLWKVVLQPGENHIEANVGSKSGRLSDSCKWNLTTQ
ncbi:glycoside hydrolase family 2 protein [Pedobacter endophyticus]|uniref:Beta-galactosidase n=1 Tax=Pedobacter endophyticus TaxID=2789740 RepID=A0A7S9KYS5_9SPHI|nr:glycoside hydrolase family 2 TIM barrel-domain containing protein [Pedobacter endophyticus]QPH39347.1 hypothetical protein IZT61_20260 [Pedobacter endophyticus]